MEKIYYIDRLTGKQEEELVFGAAFLHFLYGDHYNSPFGSFILEKFVRYPPLSHLYGWWQKRSFTKKYIQPFIEKFKVDASEFLEPIENFHSFNDFFVRKLKKESRPVAQGKEVAIIPADGRYRFFQDLSQVDGFIVKGKQFSIASLLQNETLAKKYEKGSMVMARLCPSDYHRFHFPFDCTPGPSFLLNGYLYSVNPIALKKNINIFTQNKRMITELHSELFGKVLFIEIGATNAGTIVQTFKPSQPCKKGDEKGFFSFGGSALLLLFEPDRISFDNALNTLSREMEVRCLMGQSMGIKV